MTKTEVLEESGMTFFEERKEVLKAKLEGDKEMIRKLELSIKTHSTLMEVVDENRDRFENPDDMIDQFTAINSNFEFQVKQVKTDIRKTEDLLRFIEDPKSHSVEDVLTTLLSE